MLICSSFRCVCVVLKLSFAPLTCLTPSFVRDIGTPWQRPKSLEVSEGGGREWKGGGGRLSGVAFAFCLYAVTHSSLARGETGPLDYSPRKATTAAARVAVPCLNNACTVLPLFCHNVVGMYYSFCHGNERYLPVYFFFFFLLFTTLLSQWDFSHGKFGLPSPGKASFDRVALTNLGCMLGVSVFP